MRRTYAGLFALCVIVATAAAGAEAAWEAWTNDWLFYGLRNLVAWKVATAFWPFTEGLVAIGAILIAAWEVHRFFLDRLLQKDDHGEKARPIEVFIRNLAVVVGSFWILYFGFVVNRYTFKEFWRIENSRSIFGLDVPAAVVSVSVLSANLGIVVSGILLFFVVSFCLRNALRSATVGSLLRSRALWLSFASSVALIAFATASVPGAGLDKPHIIVISIDTLRADHLGSYGYPKNTSPHIDRLASHGVLFERAFAQANWTVPSHASIFTSQLPSVHGVTSYRHSIPAHKVTLAEMLRNAGYRTAAFTGGYNLDSRYGFNQGFDIYVGDQLATLLDEEWNRLGKGPRAEKIIPMAMDWISENHRHPFFLFLHFWDTHAPYVEHPELVTDFSNGYRGPIEMVTHDLVSSLNRNSNWIRKRDLERIHALYDNEIRLADTQLGKFFDHLRKLGLFEDSIIVVTSDHGDQILEHGKMGHGQSLFDPEIHVPLIVSYPSRFQEGVRVPDVVQTIDIMPSVLELAGIQVSAETAGQIQGERLFANNSRLRPGPGVAFSEWRAAVSVRTMDFKYILAESNGDPSEALFDLRQDPEERHDVLEERPEIAAEMRLLLERQLEDNRGRRFAGTAETIDMEADFAEKLRALGYVE